MFKNKKAFTLTELIMTIAIIWILMMWMTVYIWWSDEKRAIIEAQWCANTILWEMSNYAFFALTSKSLRTNSELISPNFYWIKLDNNDTIKLFYSNEEKPTDPTKFENYRDLTVAHTCRQNNSKLQFAWDTENIDAGNISHVIMNKWFTPVDLNENRIFYLVGDDSNKYLTWDIIITLCLDNDCDVTRQFAKRSFDWRTQTISLINCAYYNDDKSECKTREGCKLYDDEDVTKCLEY